MYLKIQKPMALKMTIKELRTAVGREVTTTDRTTDRTEADRISSDKAIWKQEQEIGKLDKSTQGDGNPP